MLTDKFKKSWELLPLGSSPVSAEKRMRTLREGNKPQLVSIGLFKSYLYIDKYSSEPCDIRHTKIALKRRQITGMFKHIGLCYISIYGTLTYRLHEWIIPFTTDIQLSYLFVYITYLQVYILETWSSFIFYPFYFNYLRVASCPCSIKLGNGKVPLYNLLRFCRANV